MKNYFRKFCVSEFYEICDNEICDVLFYIVFYTENSSKKSEQKNE